MRECFSNADKWLTVVAHWGTLIVLIISACVACNQLEELKVQRQWQNFNEMNVRYAGLLSKISSEMDANCNLNDKTKIWARQYFDLYSEEYWLHQEKLIPKKIWEERIRPGVVVNLKEYPILIKGYEYWKDRGAFDHPKDFKVLVEKDIKRAEEKDPQNKPQDRCTEQIKPQSK